jgi:hypothetical protein
MENQSVREMADALDIWAERRFKFYDRNGNRIRWSEMTRLKWRCPNYPTVRRHEVRHNMLVTSWMPWALEGDYGCTYFETLLMHDGVAVVLHQARTEMEAVQLHYMALGELLFNLDAPQSEVRGWLEICQ